MTFKTVQPQQTTKQHSKQPQPTAQTTLKKKGTCKREQTHTREFKFAQDRPSIFRLPCLANTKSA